MVNIILDLKIVNFYARTAILTIFAVVFASHEGSQTPKKGPICDPKNKNLDLSQPNQPLYPQPIYKTDSECIFSWSLKKSSLKKVWSHALRAKKADFAPFRGKTPW